MLENTMTTTSEPTAHTPWVHGDHSLKCWHQRDDDLAAHLTPSCICSTSQRSDEEWERLIAAAPDLLAALKDMFALMDEGLLVRDTEGDGKSGWSIRVLGLVSRLKAADAAIAKAEGR